MIYIFIRQGNLDKFGYLSELDLLSVVIASVCHDFAHDGLTNAYHVNRVSDRALAHNDQSV